VFDVKKCQEMKKILHTLNRDTIRIRTLTHVFIRVALE